MTYKPLFSRFLSAAPEGKLHFAAHSHHYWPDVTWDAQQQAWLDAAKGADDKWGHLFGRVLPDAQAHIARVLGLPDPATIAFAPNTHDFMLRLCSCVEQRPVRVLSTDGEFLTFARQSARSEEAGQMQVTRVPVEPLDTFGDRLMDAARSGDFDLVYVSQVFYGSGFVFDRFAELVDAVRSEDCLIAIDGYHSFMALPTDLGPVADRVFFLAGGYKYAMSGEGVCFMHCPPGIAPRPVNTGWFAGFGKLADTQPGQVAYSEDGLRFHGATMDFTPLYRFNAAMQLLVDRGLDVAAIHAHVEALQRRMIEGLAARPIPVLPLDALIPGADAVGQRGHFLTFRTPHAADLHRRLAEAGVATDYRGDRLRFGFAIYHDAEDVDELLRRLGQVR